MHSKTQGSRQPFQHAEDGGLQSRPIHPSTLKCPNNSNKVPTTHQPNRYDCHCVDGPAHRTRSTWAQSVPKETLNTSN